MIVVIHINVGKRFYLHEPYISSLNHKPKSPPFNASFRFMIPSNRQLIHDKTQIFCIL